MSLRCRAGVSSPPCPSLAPRSLPVRREAGYWTSTTCRDRYQQNAVRGQRRCRRPLPASGRSVLCRRNGEGAPAHPAFAHRELEQILRFLLVRAGDMYNLKRPQRHLSTEHSMQMSVQVGHSGPAARDQMGPGGAPGPAKDPPTKLELGFGGPGTSATGAGERRTQRET